VVRLRQIADSGAGSSRARQSDALTFWRGSTVGQVACTDGWTLPLTGFELIDIWLSAETYLILYGQRGTDATTPTAPPRVQFRFGGEAELRSVDGSVTSLDGGGKWEALVPLLQLRGHRVREATAGFTGRIQLTFDNGTSLSVQPDLRYENWELSGPEELHLVSPPGGGDPRISGDLASPPD
jgi:Family of unknown function (DUF6188)